MTTYKMGVFGGGTGNSEESPSTNSCVYATREEATAAGRELLSRWTGPSGYTTIESDEPANYRFNFESGRPEPLPTE